ncbi:flagellar hook assembly protein FlgD [uncultured Sphingomonas sp.]|uniref:flagellar hook assembly protein FlgD n=1 Tax=uncultured Sphingomonas sp. TaxID=158754 RepID=UPI00262B9C93|nr:flagellar hook assembly protein FlgD [uncultured Sphingomonas sp.]
MTVITSADAAQSATATSPTKINADFNMFLKLLTTQMQHQDPLSPMDTSQYTQQLVQFSQVEQSIEQTQTLKSILGSLGTQNLTQASSLIGRQVETNSAMTGLGDAPAQWTWSASRDVASLTASVVDAKGKVVDTFPLNGGAARGTVTWDGVTAGGVKLPGGGYGLTIKGLDSSGNEVPLTVNGAGRVSDVQLSKGSVLVTVNGARFGIDELTRIGE